MNGAAAWWLLSAAWAEDDLVIEGERTEDTATARHLDRDTIEAMPGRSADDLLRAMPGLHRSAHGGHGKAYQYFLRGFDAVHGADIAVDVEGVPLNEVSNVHAHGYLDLHFLPGVLVQGVSLWPGSARAEAGDFAVAGAASFELGLAQTGATLRTGVGSDQSIEATLSWRPDSAGPGTFLVADAEQGEGVGEGRAWRQLRAAAGHEGTLGRARVRGWLLAYDGTFESPGVLREDDLASGEVDFYDAYPGSGGGQSRRVLGAVQARSGTAAHTWQATAWGGWRDFAVQQNFTGWYEDETHGDGSLQSYTAWTGGASGSGWWRLRPGLAASAGADGRLDLLSQEEDAVEPDGTVWAQEASLSALQGSLGGWASVRARPAPWLLVEPGGRAALLLIQPEDATLSWAPVLAPKLSATLFPDAAVAGFAAYGRGFRSPDARGVGDGGRAPVARSDSAELGIASDAHKVVSVQAAGFATRVSDEIVFDHIAARYLTTGTTRRLGVTTTITGRPLDTLRVEGELTWSDGRYTASGDLIPYAPRLLVVGGVYTERLPLGQTTLTSGLRAWALGPRPLPDGFASDTAAVADVTATLRWRRWAATVEVDNVLGTQWQDGTFIYASRWDQDAPRAELPVHHFTAGAPRVARLSLAWSL